MSKGLAAEQLGRYADSMMAGVSKAILVAVALGATSEESSAAEKVDPVVIVRDEEYLKRALKNVGTVEVFVASRKDAHAARSDLPRYIWVRMKAAVDRRESSRWRQVALKRSHYIWHCGGYVREESRFLFCTLSRYEKGLEAERFPEVFDGGTDYCRAHYSLKARRLVLVECNGDV